MTLPTSAEAAAATVQAEEVGVAATEATSAQDVYSKLLAEAAAAKEAGNRALRSADLPMAIEQYEDAVDLCDKALPSAAQPKVLRDNDVVQYKPGSFAKVETAHVHFGDYVIEDLGTKEVVKVKVGKYEHVPKRFTRKELRAVPEEAFNLRLACLQNLALVSLKLARASRTTTALEGAVRSADRALSMDACAPKALMRKGAALLELGRIDQAAKVLANASKETRGKDAEVQRLLDLVLSAKGKGRGKGKGKEPESPDGSEVESETDSEAERAAFESLRVPLAGTAESERQEEKAPGQPVTRAAAEGSSPIETGPDAQPVSQEPEPVAGEDGVIIEEVQLEPQNKVQHFDLTTDDADDEVTAVTPSGALPPRKDDASKDSRWDFFTLLAAGVVMFLVLLWLAGMRFARDDAGGVEEVEL